MLKTVYIFMETVIHNHANVWGNI